VFRGPRRLTGPLSLTTLRALPWGACNALGALPPTHSILQSSPHHRACIYGPSIV